ncbi:MAG TPA: amino acid ABC transporter permease [Clostridia bacterium]|nr:amino acid ABC transporter permease [Clostridia bacterium]
MGIISSVWDRIGFNLIEKQRYLYLFNGLKITLIVTFFAVLLGIAIGLLTAVVKVAAADNKKLRPFEILVNIYITVIRGTPVMVQLLIIYFVVFASVDVSKVLIAIVAFGINSGAYVSEIIRAGILAVDKGQTEAGRSLGLSSSQTFRYIVMPQALKNILPALGNEFIALLKETAVVGYIGLQDLTMGGDIIRSRTYDAFVPLLTVAAVYLIIVMILTAGLKRLERRLRQSDIR